MPEKGDSLGNGARQGPGAVDAPGARRSLRGAAVALAVASVYFVTAWFSLDLSLVGRSVTPLWPPTGIALVAILLIGARVWPAIVGAAFAVNLVVGSSPATAAAIAAGNTLAPVAAAALLRRVGFRPALDRTRDAVALVVAGALCGMTISATVGSVALRAAGSIDPGTFWSTWAVWWTGDAMGILAVAPFLLGVRSMTLRHPFAWKRIWEAVLLFVALASIAFLITTTMRPVWVAVFPLLVWIAWRFEQRGAGLAALIVIGTASWSATREGTPFGDGDLLQRMVVLQVFNAAVSLTSFFFAAVVAERTAARRELERSARELYQREHRIAETLQRSLLPEGLPAMPDIEMAARYIPATTEVEVGGDWYDTIPLSDGRIALLIGDVAGQGVPAAASMGQMRMALRAYALEGLSPGRALERLNALLIELHPGSMATLVCAHLDAEAGTLTVASAGHPPPLVVAADGSTSFLEPASSPPLGVGLRTFAQSTVELEVGSMLVLFTDGLVERRGESITEGMARLARAAAGAPYDLEEAGDHLIAALIGDGAADDTAMLLIRRVALTGRPLDLMLPAEAGSLAPLRRALGRWLRQNGAADDEAAEVLVACTEACANAMQHAYGSRDGWIEVSARPRAGSVEVHVRDFGSWKPPADEGDERGRGLYLMRELMDTVEISSDAEGTDVTMRRRVGSLVQHG